MNSYNRLSLLKEALDTLLKALPAVPIASSVVILDAGSDDGSVEHIQSVMASKQATPIHLIQPGKATSFSEGCNMAVAEAAQLFPKLEYCWFYETDNFIHNPQALRDAITLLRDKPELGAVGFTVENHKGERVGHGERFPTFFTFLLGSVLHSKLAPKANAIKTWKTHKGLSWAPFDIVYTSPLLVKLEAWQAVDGMDSDMFPFSDSDLDLAWQLHKKGYQSAVLQASGVWHDNLSQASAWSSKRTIDLHRARYKLLRRHRGGHVALLKPLLFLRHLAEYLLLNIQSGSQRVIESRKTRIFLLKSVFKGYAS